MQLNRRSFATALLLAAGSGALADGAVADGGDGEIPLEYADSVDALPNVSTTPAVGVTPGGVYLARDVGSWEGPLAVEPDGGEDDVSTSTATTWPPDGIEVVHPADGYEAVQSVLDEYGWDPVTVLLTAGTLTVETNLRIPSNTWLRGVGRQTVVRLADGARLDVSGIVRVPGDHDDVAFSDFVIDGNRANVENHGHEYGFFTKDATNVRCERLEVRNCPGYGFDPHAGSMWETTTDVRIRNCRAVGNGKDGITLAGVENGIVEGCVAKNNDRYGVHVTDPDNRGVTISNTVSAKNGEAGIVVQNGPRYVTIANNIVRENGGDGIKVSSVDDTVSHCTITGNAIYQNERYGLAILRAHHVGFVGNTLRNNAGEAGNAECLLKSGDGWSASECLLLGNTVRATDARYGIDDRSDDGAGHAIVGNVLTGAESQNLSQGESDVQSGFNVGTSS